jgi:hypothetical protein
MEPMRSQLRFVMHPDDERDFISEVLHDDAVVLINGPRWKSSEPEGHRSYAWRPETLSAPSDLREEAIPEWDTAMAKPQLTARSGGGRSLSQSEQSRQCTLGRAGGGSLVTSRTDDAKGETGFKCARRGSNDD